MKDKLTTDQRFLNVEKKIGVFIFIGTIGIIATIVFVGVRQNVFTPKKKLYFITDSGKDIKEGQTITLSGFKIGTVSKVLLEDIARVNVELSINSEYMEWIKADAKAKLTKDLPIGESTIEIIPGSKNRGKVRERGVIGFEKVEWFAGMTKNLNPIPITVAKSPYMEKLFIDLKDDFQLEIDPLLTDIKYALKNLKMFSDESLVTKDHINSMLKNVDNSLASLDNLLGLLSNDLPVILDKLDESLEITQKLINEGLGVASDAKEITEALKETWPISSHIKKKMKLELKKERKEQNFPIKN